MQHARPGLKTALEGPPNIRLVTEAEAVQIESVSRAEAWIAVGETAILPPPPSSFSRCFNRDGMGSAIKLTVWPAARPGACSTRSTSTATARWTCESSRRF